MGESFLRTKGMQAPTESLLSELDRCAQDSVTPSKDSAAQAQSKPPSQDQAAHQQVPVTQSRDLVTPSSVTRSAVRPPGQPAETPVSQSRTVSPDEVPIGVAEVPIGVWGSRRAASVGSQLGKIEVFAEETSTVIVFPHGAVIRLSATVAPGQMMMVTNRESHQVTACRVVKARNYPNVKGYAEIEFFRSTKGFWGDYIPQGTMKAATGTPAASPDGLSEDFWNDKLQKDAISALAKSWSDAPAGNMSARGKVSSIGSRAVQTPSTKTPQPATSTPASTQHPQRDESANERSWILDLLASLREQAIARIATSSPSPKPRMAFAWVAMTCLFLMIGTGLYVRHRGEYFATTQPAPAPEAAAAASTTNGTERAQVQSNPGPDAPAVPFTAGAENFPGSQSRGFADNVRNSQPAVKASSLGKILNGKPLAAPVAAHRTAITGSRDVPPNLSGVNPNNGADATPGVFAAFIPSGGHVKEPRLLLSSTPIYPAIAKRAGVEGEVTVAAVIDVNGKLTSMKIISGSPLLQQAALDSLAAWKYEPAYLNDKPVPVQTSVIVKFHLR